MAKFSGKCGEDAAITASFDQKMSVAVYVKNKGDCDVRIQLALAEKDEATGLTELTKRRYRLVSPGFEKTFRGDDVTDVVISCEGEKKDGRCRFRYTIDAD